MDNTFKGRSVEDVDEHWQRREDVVLDVSLRGTPDRQSPMIRSNSLGTDIGNSVLVPETDGSVSEVAYAMDDMYIEGVSLRRSFASEFLAMLEVCILSVGRLSVERR